MKPPRTCCFCGKLTTEWWVEDEPVLSDGSSVWCGDCLAVAIIRSWVRDRLRRLGGWRLGEV